MPRQHTATFRFYAELNDFLPPGLLEREAHIAELVRRFQLEAAAT